MSEFKQVHNPLLAIPGKVLLEELRFTSVTLMADHQLAAGTAMLDLMPPDLFDASEVSGHLRVNSAEGAYGGDVTFRVGPQSPDAVRPYVSVKTTEKGVVVHGSGAGALLLDSLSAVTTESGTVNVSHVHAARNIRLFPDLPSQVHIGDNVAAAGAIIVRVAGTNPQLPPEA